MKKLSIIIALLITTAIVAQSQRQDKVKAFKVAFITERLELNPEEAQAFWPVYNVFQDKMSAILASERQFLRSVRDDWDGLSDNEAQQTLEKIQEAERQKLEAKSTLIKSLGQTLSPKKILVLLKTEEDFKRRLLNRLRDGRGGRNNRN
ncbi:MAG: hypothetical protein ABNH00_09940 [Dokdonia sp.]|jgi:hypothetical protein